MGKPQVDFKFIILCALAPVLSYLTLVGGAVPMRLIRKLYGRSVYWLSMVFVSTAVFAVGLEWLALVLFSLTLVVGSFSEMEDHGFAFFPAAGLAVLSTLGVASLVVSLWLRTKGMDLMALLRQNVNLIKDQLVAINSKIEVDVDAVLVQIPSAVVIILIFALAAALMAEGKLKQFFGVDQKAKRQMSLRKFKLPDFMVWVFILALLGSFLQFDMPSLQGFALNVFYVLIVLYFFQGLAIVASFFQLYQVTPLWQVLFYLLLVIQGFLVVSLLGFVDFWIDFRQRLSRKSATGKGV